MQKPHLPVRADKLPRLMGYGIGPRTETCVNWGGPIAMVPCLHQGNMYIQRKLQIWTAQKCILLVGSETPLTCAGRQTAQPDGGRYMAENGNLRKLGWTYRHGTVFTPRQYVYPKKAMGMDSPEMYSTRWCRNPTHLCGPVNYPVSLGTV